MIRHRWDTQKPMCQRHKVIRSAPIFREGEFRCSWWFNSFLRHKRTKRSGAAAGADRQAGRRILRVEQLEDRQLLSIVPGVTGLSNPGPTISHVVASQGVLTWNAVDSGGVESSGLTVDGAAVTTVEGPYAAPTGLNYAWPYGNSSAAGISLASGTHSYVITATGNDGNASQYAGTFTVGSDTGPTISEVVVSAAQGVITWNAAAAAGVASSSLTIDGTAVKNVYGPYTAPPGVNYSGAYGTLSSGSHTYVITATDDAGNSWQYTGRLW